MTVSRSHFSSLAVALGLAALLAGCMTRAPAPVVERTPVPPSRAAGPPPQESPTARAGAEAPPATYTVKRGDTLYQIALDHGLDYRDLAAWNNIENVNKIHVGQVLALAAPGGSAPGASAEGVVTSPLVTSPPVVPSTGEARPLPLPSPGGRANTATFKTEPKAVKLPYSEQALAQLRGAAPAVAEDARAPSAEARASPGPQAATSSALPARPDGARVPEIDDDNLGWVWPTEGKVIAGFSESANLKGIDIAGKAGQPVVASAAGKVVYVGSGLRGYGKLVIVKHNATFLSAYAHNREILVKEGQQVAKGQKIAEMGDSDSDRVELHFEIRRLGKPVDPAKFLPPV
jgi:lipoprotein NlpD